jgi:gamma-glutamyltranspeptidase/glutathione hydrolase
MDTVSSAKPGFVPAHDVRNGTVAAVTSGANGLEDADYKERLWAGTTSVEAADAEGWVVLLPLLVDGCLPVLLVIQVWV